MYVKFQNAAVFVSDTLAKQDSVGKLVNLPRNAPPPYVTLWANRAFTVPKGRLVGVRKTGKSVEVALMATGGASVAWLSPEGLLTQAQVDRWLTSSSFR